MSRFILDLKVDTYREGFAGVLDALRAWIFKRSFPTISRPIVISFYSNAHTVEVVGIQLEVK